MKTRDVPAIVMLSAGTVYCFFGIFYQIPLTEFLTNLLLVLLIFWIFGGIIKIVLDKFMGEIGEKLDNSEENNSEEDNSKDESQENDSQEEILEENE